MHKPFFSSQNPVTVTPSPTPPPLAPPPLVSQVFPPWSTGQSFLFLAALDPTPLASHPLSVIEELGRAIGWEQVMWREIQSSSSPVSYVHLLTVLPFLPLNPPLCHGCNLPSSHAPIVRLLMAHPLPAASLHSHM